MVLQMENTRQKQNSCWKYTDKNIPLVIVAYAVNIFQLSVKCRQTKSVCISVGDYGISSKVFATLGKIPTECFRL
jgi:hypothetical protein